MRCATGQSVPAQGGRRVRVHDGNVNHIRFSRLVVHEDGVRLPMTPRDIQGHLRVWDHRRRPALVDCMGESVPHGIVRANVPTQAGAVVQVHPVRRRKDPFTPRSTVVRVGGLHRGDAIEPLQRAREGALVKTDFF